MKKLIVIFMASLIVLSMSFVSFAVTPLNMGPVGATFTAVDSSTNPITTDADIYTVQGSAPALQENYINSGQIQSAMSSAHPGIDITELKVIGIYDLELLPNNGAYSDVTITITPSMQGIVATTTAGLFQYDGSNWHLMNTLTGQGIVSATFGTFENPSPMVLVVDESTLEQGPDPDVTITKISGKDKNGVDILGTMVTGSPEDLQQYFGGDPLPKPVGFPSVIINTKYPDVTNDDLVLLKLFDLDVSSEVLPNAPLTFTFNCPGVTENTVIYVLNLNEGWVLVDAEVGNGTVTAHFDHLSPVYIYAEAEGDEEDAGPAPVMGDGPMATAMIILVISLFGMAWVYKKE